MIIDKIKNLVFTPSISGLAAFEKVEAGNAVLLDVRELHERKVNYIKGSEHIPVSKVKPKINQLKKFIDKDIIVYCASGIRSKMITALLISNGFKAYNLKGGIDTYLNIENENNTNKSSFT